MAGPAIRAWHLADCLAADHDVELVTTGLCELESVRFNVCAVDEAALRGAVRRCEVLICQGWLLAGRPWIVLSDVIIVCDIYDPLHLEQLEHSRDHGGEKWRREVHGAVAVLNEQLRRGDFFTCASEKQRAFWLGQLAGMGRVNPANYGADPTLRRLIDVVPFGCSDAAPVAERSAIRGVLPGVDDTSKVVLWGGGIYNWFDPITLIKAVDRLRHRHPELRLVFMGVQHPNPEVPTMRVAVEAQQLAHQLGLAGSVIHFNEGWVPFAERQELLLDADIGVSSHFDHLETEFSFRTRILDYLWAGLPMVLTAGDFFAELIDQRAAGLVVPAQDVAALEAALDELLSDPKLFQRCAEQSRNLGLELRWSEVTEPLQRFCQRPARAPDMLDELQLQLIHHQLVILTKTRSALWHNLRSAVRMLRDDGPKAACSRIVERALGLVGRAAGRIRPD